MAPEVLIDIIKFALPSGFVGAVITWFVGRRKRNNDMLSELQASINMLAEENRKILAENVQLRKENAKLQANQEEMIQQLSALKKEIERLQMKMNNKITTKK